MKDKFFTEPIKPQPLSNRVWIKSAEGCYEDSTPVKIIRKEDSEPVKVYFDFRVKLAVEWLKGVINDNPRLGWEKQFFIQKIDQAFPDLQNVTKGGR